MEEDYGRSERQEEIVLEPESTEIRTIEQAQKKVDELFWYVSEILGPQVKQEESYSEQAKSIYNWLIFLGAKLAETELLEAKIKEEDRKRSAYTHTQKLAAYFFDQLLSKAQGDQSNETDFFRIAHIFNSTSPNIFNLLAPPDIFRYTARFSEIKKTQTSIAYDLKLLNSYEVFDGIMGHDIEAFEKQFFEGSVLDQIDWLRGALIALDHKQFEQNVGYETDLIHIGKIADNIYRSSKQALVKSLAGIVYNMAYQYYHNPDAMNMRWGPRTEATTSSITQEIYKGHQVLDKMIFLNEELGKEDFLYQLSAEQVGVMDQAGTLQQIVCSHAAEQKLIEDGYMYGIMRDRIPLKQALKENRAYSPWPDTSAEDQLRLFRQFHRPEIQEVLTHQYGIPIRELRSHTQMQLFRILSQDNSVQTLERLGAIVEQHGVPYLDMLYLTADPRKRQDDVLENILSFAENQPADVVARASEYAYEFVSQVREVEQAIGKHAEESQIKNVPKTESVVRQMTKRLVRCVEQLSKSEKTLAPADVDALMAQVHKDAVFFASFFKELITSSSQDSIHIKDLYGVDLSDKPGTELTPEYKKAMIALYKKCWGNDGIKGEDLCNKYAAELESPPEGTTYYLLQKDNKLITSVKSIPVPEEGDRDVYIGSLITDPSYARASLAQAVSKLAVSAELKKGNIVHGAFSLDQKAGTSYVSDLGFVISRVDRVTLSDGTTYDRIHIMSSQALLDSLETKQDGWETNKGAQTRRFPADTPETEVIEEINSMLQQGYLGTQYAIDPNTGEKTFIFEQDPRTMKQAA